ncbi:MAG: hypothetical protein DKT66_23440 [Candidatus Melainabacteria bacterium]|nr:MAG: hypothetical protein DKT66_23440 [Candidatus Melainabacteria bacterium]
MELDQNSAQTALSLMLLVVFPLSLLCAMAWRIKCKFRLAGDCPQTPQPPNHNEGNSSEKRGFLYCEKWVVYLPAGTSKSPQ